MELAAQPAVRSRHEPRPNNSTDKANRKDDMVWLWIACTFSNGPRQEG
jgi:hypothetical protein